MVEQNADSEESAIFSNLWNGPCTLHFLDVLSAVDEFNGRRRLYRSVQR